MTMSELPESVGTIGAGNMAGAILRGLLRAGMRPEQLLAADPDATRRAHLETFGKPSTKSGHMGAMI